MLNSIVSRYLNHYDYISKKNDTLIHDEDHTQIVVKPQMNLLLLQYYRPNNTIPSLAANSIAQPSSFP